MWCLDNIPLRSRKWYGALNLSQMLWLGVHSGAQTCSSQHVHRHYPPSCQAKAVFWRASHLLLTITTRVRVLVATQQMQTEPSVSQQGHDWNCVEQQPDSGL